MAEDIKLHTARLIIHTPWVEDAQDVFTLMKGYMAEVVESMKRYLFMEWLYFQIYSSINTWHNTWSHIYNYTWFLGIYWPLRYRVGR